MKRILTGIQVLELYTEGAVPFTTLTVSYESGQTTGTIAETGKDILEACQKAVQSLFGFKPQINGLEVGSDAFGLFSVRGSVSVPLGEGHFWSKTAKGEASQMSNAVVRFVFDTANDFLEHVEAQA